MQLSVTVSEPGSLADEVNSWQDGAEYELRVRQVSPGKFELLDAGSAAVTATTAPEPPEEGIPAAAMSMRRPKR